MHLDVFVGWNAIDDVDGSFVVAALTMESGLMSCPPLEAIC